MSNNTIEFKQRWNNATDSGTDHLMHRVDYSYDEFLRPTLEKTTVAFNLSGVDGGGDFISTKEKSYYEDNNWLLQETYRSNLEPGYSVVYAYTNFGENYKQIENPTQKVLSEIAEFTPRGEVKSNQFYDNTTQADYLYYHTGQVASINNTYLSGNQTFEYDYDAWGNIDEKRLFDGGIEEASENFTYDNLQRLYSSQVDGADLINYRYDNLGNLLQKTDYTNGEDDSEYGITAGPNAITTLYHENDYILTYGYDAVGNRINDYKDNIPKATYEYDAFNLLTYSQQHETANEILFRYGIDNQRYLKIEQSENAQNSKTIDEVTLYAGPQFEAIRNDREGVSESKIHVTPYLTVTRKDDQTIRRHFKFQDRLGSTTLITKQNGEKVKALSYDAFGKPRNGEDWRALSNPVLDFQDSNLTADITKRGFTEHEHLDNFELIHMNGRMYDFNNGRFLSVDPFIHGVTSQGINPYSYILNNPLAGTDPTGYLPCKDGIKDDCNPKPKKKERRRKRASAGVWGVIQVNNGGSAERLTKKQEKDLSKLGNHVELATPEEQFTNITNNFIHKNEHLKAYVGKNLYPNFEEYVSSLPIDTKIALLKFSKTGLGRKVVNYLQQSGNKVTLIESFIYAPEAFNGTFQTIENDIYYTRDLKGFIKNSQRVTGDEMESATLGALLAHEIGHTNYALDAVSLPYIKIYTTKDLRQAELRTVNKFENNYRKFYNLPLRKSYFEENDVLNYMNKEN